MTLFGNVCVRQENYWFLGAHVRRQKIIRMQVSRRAVSFGPLFCSCEEVSFGGIQRRVERQPQLHVEMHQGDRIFLPVLGVDNPRTRSGRQCRI